MIYYIIGNLSLSIRKERGKVKPLRKWTDAFAWLCVLVLILSTLPLYVISFDNHPYYDDFGFSAGVHKAWKETGSMGAVLSAAVESAADTRQTWQGTYTGTILSNLQPGLFSENLYWISSFVLLTALIVCFWFFFDTAFGQLGLEKWARTSLACMAITLMIQFMPDVGEAFFWFNGGIGNVFIYSMLALAAALCIRLLCRPGRGIGLTVLLVGLAVVLGGGSYGGGLFALCMCAGLLVWLFVQKHAKRWRMTALTALFLACFLYSVAAPGNTVRANVIQYDSSAVKAILQSLYYGVAQLGSYIDLPIIAITLVLLPALYQAAQKSRFDFEHPWLVLTAGVCLYCTQLTPPLYSGVFIGGGRIVNTYFVSFVALWFLYAYYLAGFCARRLSHVRLPEMNARRFGALALVALCLLAAGCLGFKRSGDAIYGVQNLSGPSAALSLLNGEAKQYDAEMTQREALLNDEAQPVITLAPLHATPAVFMDDLIEPDAVYDVRPSLCLYYGKEAIHIEGEANGK